jgi:dienelactone hydrolase
MIRRAMRCALVGVLAPAVASGQRTAVGFTTFTILDSTRSWERPIRGDRSAVPWQPRPVRVSLWYPARVATGSAMRVRDYLSVRDGATFVRQVLDGDSTKLSIAGAHPSSARRDATPLARKSPLILYSAGLNSYAADNAFLAESLARRGFMVAAVAQEGMSSDQLDLGTSARDVETQVRDLEVAFARLRGRRDVNAADVGVIGWSMGAVATLVLASRHPEVRALASLDPSFNFRNHPSKVTAFPGFLAEHVTVPMLVLEQHSADATDAVVDSLVYARRDVIRYPGVVHEDFTMGAEIAAAVGARTTRRSTAHALRASRDIGARVIAFMEAHLRGDSSALRTAIRSDSADVFPAGHVQQRRMTDRAAPASASQLALFVERRGLDSVIAFVKRGPDSISIREAEVNSLAYSLLGGARRATAVALFRLNVAVFPSSANAFDSLADGLRAIDDRDGAANAYRRVLALVDTDLSLSAETRETLRVNANRFLKLP